MIETRVNTPFEVLARYAPTGLVGTISVEVYDASDGSAVVPAGTAGVTEPRPHTYRAVLTVMDVGTFQVRWTYIDPATANEVVQEEEVRVTSLGAVTVPVGEMLPEVIDVADLLQSRTRSTVGGALLHTFTDKTEPTDERVYRHIDKAYDRVRARTGPITDPDLIEEARQLVTLYAAMMVELTHYSEQINTDKSPYKELKKLYDEGMAALVESLGAEGLSAVDDAPVATDTYSGSPYYDFPPTSIGDGIMP